MILWTSIGTGVAVAASLGIVVWAALDRDTSNLVFIVPVWLLWGLLVLLPGITYEEAKKREAQQKQQKQEQVENFYDCIDKGNELEWCVNVSGVEL